MPPPAPAVATGRFQRGGERDSGQGVVLEINPTRLRAETAAGTETTVAGLLRRLDPELGIKDVAFELPCGPFVPTFRVRDVLVAVEGRDRDALRRAATALWDYHRLRLVVIRDDMLEALRDRAQLVQLIAGPRQEQERHGSPAAAEVAAAARSTAGRRSRVAYANRRRQPERTVSRFAGVVFQETRGMRAARQAAVLTA